MTFWGIGTMTFFSSRTGCPRSTALRLAAARSSAARRLSVLGAAALLASCGCSHKAPSVEALSVGAAAVPPPAASVQGGSSPRAVQSTPQYRQAVRFFARRDYPHALAAVDRLLAEPQVAQDPVGSGFLRSQQAICRHALNPEAPYPVAPHPQDAQSPRPSPLAGSAARADCGPRALLLVCQALGTPATLDELRRQAGTTAAGTSLHGLAQAAQAHGLKAKGVQVDLPALEQVAPPAIAWVDGNHYVALLSVEGRQATVHDPNQPKEEVTSTRELLQRSGGVLLTLSRERPGP